MEEHVYTESYFRADVDKIKGMPPPEPIKKSYGAVQPEKFTKRKSNLKKSTDFKPDELLEERTNFVLRKNSTKPIDIAITMLPFVDTQPDFTQTVQTVLDYYNTPAKIELPEETLKSAIYGVRFFVNEKLVKFPSKSDLPGQLFVDGK